jgi:hypothetical protein
MSDGLAHEVTLSFVETAPAEIDAGMDLALKVRVSCSSGCDLRGRMVRILAQGAVVKEMGVELTEFDGDRNRRVRREGTGQARRVHVDRCPSGP